MVSILSSRLQRCEMLFRFHVECRDRNAAYTQSAVYFSTFNNALQLVQWFRSFGVLFKLLVKVVPTRSAIDRMLRAGLA